jgi:hypothetical protein
LNKNNFLLKFVGGEWQINEGDIKGGHMYDMARNLSGLMIYTEFRYYGFTHPTPDLKTSNMKYLSIDQGLADLAHFIEYIKSKIPQVQNSGVILTGCSFSGSLVTWFQQKYPHLVNGVWATSGPIHTVVENTGYKEVASKAFRDIGGNSCSERIKNGIYELESFADDGNYSYLTQMFQLCYPVNINGNLDVWSFFSEIAGTLSSFVQFSNQLNRAIGSFCEELVAIETTTDYEAIAHWFVQNYWNLESHQCYDTRFENYVSQMNKTDWNDWAARSNWRQWVYQACTEMGSFQLTGGRDIIFGTKFPVELAYQWCLEIYDGM